jgi:hypothetical protein
MRLWAHWMQSHKTSWRHELCLSHITEDHKFHVQPIWSLYTGINEDQCTDFIQVEHRICNWCDMRQVELTSLRCLKIASNKLAILYLQSVSIKTQSKHKLSNKSCSNVSASQPMRSLYLLTFIDFSQLLLMTCSFSVIFSLMSPFSEMEYQIWWWNILQLSYVITSISYLPSDSISAQSS